MITSTSINASFIAKLVHATNVAIACESYCEILTSKGKPSVLVEWDVSTSSLRFTHVSGQDVTSVCWQAIEHLVSVPSTNIVPVAELVEQEDSQEPVSYEFIFVYLAFVLLALLMSFNVISWGSALLSMAFAAVAWRLAPALVGASYSGSREPSSGLSAQ